MLKLKLPYFGHLMGRTDSLEKTLMMGKTEDSGKRGRLRVRWLDGTSDSISSKQWRRGEPGSLQSDGSQRIRCELATEQQLVA